jgi:hypothetical protein
MAFIPVTDIKNFSPTLAIVGMETQLSADVVPSNSTNREIVWSIVSGSATVYKKEDGKWYIKPTASGAITLRALIVNGTAE